MTDTLRAAVERAGRELRRFDELSRKRAQLIARYPVTLLRYITGQCYFQRPEWKELRR